MKNNIPCEMIKDVLPSYVDKLTSDVTNNLVEEHINECKDCKNILESMQDSSIGNIGEDDKKEIDFLKKNRKKNTSIIIGSVMVVIAILVVIFAKIFLIGDKVRDDIVACDVKVEGNKLNVNANMMDSVSGISSIDFKEKDGVVTIEFRTVKMSLFHSGEVSTDYLAKDTIKTVRTNARILWSEGEYILPITSELYSSRHDYIGSAWKNNATAQALNMSKNLGEFTDELQTSQEPYEWKIIMTDNINESDEEIKKKDMKSYAYLLIATIGNLDRVTYKYKVNEKQCELTVSKDEATEYAEKDIKECGANIYLLQKLIEKTGISVYKLNFIRMNVTKK